MLHAVCVYACSLSVKQNIYKELLNQYYKLLCPACPNNFMPGSVVMTAYNLLHARFTEPAWLVRLLPEELFGVEPSPASNDCSWLQSASSNVCCSGFALSLCLRILPLPGESSKSSGVVAALSRFSCARSAMTCLDSTGHWSEDLRSLGHRHCGSEICDLRWLGFV